MVAPELICPESPVPSMDCSPLFRRRSPRLEARPSHPAGDLLPSRGKSRAALSPHHRVGALSNLPESATRSQAGTQSSLLPCAVLSECFVPWGNKHSFKKKKKGIYSGRSHLPQKLMEIRPAVDFHETPPGQGRAPLQLCGSFQGPGSPMGTAVTIGERSGFKFPWHS